MYDLNKTKSKRYAENKPEKDKFKIIIIVMAILIVMIYVTAIVCGYNERLAKEGNIAQVQEEIGGTFDLVEINRNNGVVFYRETITDVIYIQSNGDLTALLNPKTGLPLTYKECVDNEYT